MNNLTIAILMKVANLAQTSGVITKVADKLLNGLIPQEDALAESCRSIACSGCFGSSPNRVRYCTRICCAAFRIPACVTRFVRVSC